jgi:hypothetical protein
LFAGGDAITGTGSKEIDHIYVVCSSKDGRGTQRYVPSQVKERKKMIIYRFGQAWKGRNGYGEVKR